jgi:hypothetical protein
VGTFSFTGDPGSFLNGGVELSRGGGLAISDLCGFSHSFNKYYSGWSYVPGTDLLPKAKETYSLFLLRQSTLSTRDT